MTYKGCFLEFLNNTHCFFLVYATPQYMGRRSSPSTVDQIKLWPALLHGLYVKFFSLLFLITIGLATFLFTHFNIYDLWRSPIFIHIHCLSWPHDHHMQTGFSPSCFNIFLSPSCLHSFNFLKFTLFGYIDYLISFWSSHTNRYLLIMFQCIALPFTTLLILDKQCHQTLCKQR